MQTKQQKLEAGYGILARLVVHIRMRDDLLKRQRVHVGIPDGACAPFYPWLTVTYKEEIGILSTEIESGRAAIRSEPMIYGYVRENNWAVMS